MRPGGTARLAVRRLGSDRVVAFLAGVLLAAAVAVPATGALYADRVALAGLRTSFLAGAPAQRSVRIAIDAPLTEVARDDAGMTREAIAALGPGATVVRTVRSQGFAIDGHGADLGALASFDGIAAHAALAVGRWPAPGRAPAEAALAAPAAAALGIGVGDVVSLHDPQDAGTTIAVRVVGTWRADASDPYWEDEPLDLTGVETVRLTSRGPFVVDAADLAVLVPAATVTAEWRGFPDPARLDPTSAEAIRSEVGLLQARVTAVAGPTRSAVVTTALPDRLATLARAGIVGRQTILLLVVQLVVLALVALLLVGGVMAGRRRREELLFRERGATVLDGIATAFAEGLVLAVPAAAVAVGVAALVADAAVRATVGVAPGVPSGPDGSTVAIAAAAALVGAGALAAPSLRVGASLVGLRAAIGRRVGRTFGQRIGLDAVLAVLGALAIWQLRTYGTSSASSAVGARSVDPVLVLAPALGLVAGTAVVTRLVPRVAEIAERGMGRPRGLVVALGGRELARRPQRTTRVALLVVLAAALATLAATHAATWRASQADQAAFAVPTDLRVVAGPSRALPTLLVGPAIRALPGVTAADPVIRTLAPSGPAAGATLLGVDVAALARLAATPAAPAALASLRDRLGGLVADAPADRGVALPDGATRLAVSIDADLTLLDFAGDPVPGADGGSVGVVLVLRDADGRIARLPLGSAAPGGRTDLEASLVASADTSAGAIAVGTAPGLRLLGVELSVLASNGLLEAGTVDLAGVRVTTDPPGTAATWRRVDLDPASTGWAWTRTDGATVAPYEPPAAAWRRLSLAARIGPGGAAGQVNGPSVFALAPSASAAATTVPALVDPRFLATTGAAVGDLVDGSAIADGVRLRIVGTYDLFPTLDPARPSIVVDRSRLELARWAAGGSDLAPTEWWLATTPAADPATLEAALLATPFQALSVDRRANVEAAGLDDPIALGSIGALVLGALAALAFSTLGYLVHAATSTTDAAGELALLRAVGVSRRQVVAWLWAQHAALLAFSIVAGAALGLLLAWLVVPTATLTPAGRAPVPPAAILVPVELPVALAVAGVALLLGAGLVVARLAGALDVPGILRGGADR